MASRHDIPTKKIIPDSARDVTVENHGTVYLFEAHSAAARRWIKENVGADAMFVAGKLAVEHRCARDLTDGMVADGLVVR